MREPFAGAWQRNISIDLNTVHTFHAIFACETLIASDCSKLAVLLKKKDGDGIWTETTNPAYSPVLRRPNHYQNRIQYWESYFLSKLRRGNVYVLKGRDNRNVVTELYPLDPCRVRPLISDSGDVFYELSTDNLSGVGNEVIVPAREIIHDRMNCLFHPLVGISPLYANGLAATQGLNIQNNSVRLFANGCSPGGILTAPGKINQETADRLKATWEENYTGNNVGRVAVLGDGLKFEKMAFTAVEGQVIEQLKWGAEVVCSTYHVPPYKIGVGQMPAYANIQSLNVEYYSQCLQAHIEAAELCLDEGLEMGTDIGTEFDIDGLLRMDSVTQMEVLEKASGVLSINEKRAKLDKPRVVGGNSVYLQQQNFSLEALAKRDAQSDPFSTGKPSEQAQLSPPPNEPAQLPPPKRYEPGSLAKALEYELAA